MRSVKLNQSIILSNPGELIMNTQELFTLTQYEIKGEVKLGKVLAVATSYEWGEEKQQICFQVEGESLGQWVTV